jgi:hypothetical protein
MISSHACRRVARLSSRQQASSEQQQQTAAGRPSHLFGPTSTLRLYFFTPPPAAVPAGCFFPVSIYLANEFGLFDRNYLGEGVQGLELECSLLHATESAGHLEARRPEELVWVYAFIYACFSICVYACLCECLRACMPVYVFTFIDACVNACVYTCLCQCIHVHVCTRTLGDYPVHEFVCIYACLESWIKVDYAHVRTSIHMLGCYCSGRDGYP